MKVLTLLAAFVIWLVIIVFARIHLTVSYRLAGLASKVQFTFRLFVARIRIDLTVPQDMLASGVLNLVLNMAGEAVDVGSTSDTGGANDAGSAEPAGGGKKADGQKTKSRRFRFLVKFVRGVLHHYIFSWSAFLYIQHKLKQLSAYFFKKIKVYRFHVSVQLGTDDAANTAVLTGLCWAAFGHLRSRLYRSFTVVKNDIRYHVVPNFQTSMFLGRLNCILSVKISHIIFTAYKFLLAMVKLRRTRNYG